MFFGVNYRELNTDLIHCCDNLEDRTKSRDHFCTRIGKELSMEWKFF